MIELERGAKFDDYSMEDEDGNDLFDFGGKDNQLSETGKRVLDKMLHGDKAMKVVPFENHVAGRPALCLNFYEERARCLRQKIMFEDPEFPAVFESIFPGEIPPDHQWAKTAKIEWKRPGEIAPNPQLISGGVSRFDAEQGGLGDCYMIATTATLAMHEELFYRVVPPDQSFTEDYAGIFHFQIWRYGQWVDVVIDDRLPTIDGKLQFMRSADGNEFWSALLEKAYAKLYGSYYVIEGGFAYEVMEDYTGGIVEYYATCQVPRQSLLEVIKGALRAGSLVNTGIGQRYNYQESDAGGLYGGHAYSITAVTQVTNLDGGETDIIRIRNPHGGAREWTGAWGEKSDEWNHVIEEDRIKLDRKPDGEFWMGFDDYIKEFSNVHICTLGPEGIDELCQMAGKGLDMWDPAWRLASINGRWTELSSLYTYRVGLQNNPQYLLHLPKGVRDNSDEEPYTVIMTLLQKNRREIRTMQELYLGTNNNYFIATPVYSCSEALETCLDDEDDDRLKLVSKPRYIPARDVTRRCVLKPGYYLLAPTALDAKEACDFLFRILVNGPFELRELKESGSVNIETYESKTGCAA